MMIESLKSDGVQVLKNMTKYMKTKKMFQLKLTL